jgi:DNA-binding MarR family transcriptional regulator
MDTRISRPDGDTLTLDNPASPAAAQAPAGQAPRCAITGDEDVESASLDGDALEAWRSYLQSHATILRFLDAELVSEHRITTRDYEVLLYLAQAPDQKLPMSALAESTMLTRSGITRLVDGLVAGGFIERVAYPNDARVSYAQLTDEGLAKLRRAGCTHVRSIRRLFLEHFSPEETAQLASLLGRLPGAQRGGSCTVEGES